MKFYGETLKEKEERFRGPKEAVNNPKHYNMGDVRLREKPKKYIVLKRDPDTTLKQTYNLIVVTDKLEGAIEIIKKEVLKGSPIAFYKIVTEIELEHNLNIKPKGQEEDLDLRTKNHKEEEEE